MPGTKTVIIVLLSLLIAAHSTAQTDSISWTPISPGIDYAEVDAPNKSFLNDSRLSILKIDPDSCRFELLCASEHQNITRTAPEWAEEFGVQVVVNAGMYSLTQKLKGRYYMKNHRHFNNADFSKSGNAMMAFNPVSDTIRNFRIADLTCDSWECLQAEYNSFSQGMRMLTCDGTPLAWDKNPRQSCSMLLASTNDKGTIYFIFCRSPYTHQAMIGFIKQLPLNLQSTIYLEGGPETSFYVNNGDQSITKMGSYVYRTYPNDDNYQFWKLPNVIGISSGHHKNSTSDNSMEK